MSIGIAGESAAYGHSTGTDKAGRFRFTGLEGGKYNLLITSMTQAWIADPLHDIALAAGKQTNLPACIRASVPRWRAGWWMPGAVRRL